MIAIAYQGDAGRPEATLGVASSRLHDGSPALLDLPIAHFGRRRAYQ